MKKIALFLVIISLLFGIIVPGCNGEEDSNGGNGYAPPPPTPASFTLSNLIVDSPFSSNAPDLPAEVYPGEMVFIMVYVSNASKTQVSDDVILIIDGVEEKAQPVIRSPYGGENVIFTVSRQSVGTYDVSIGSLSGTFVVVPPVDLGRGSIEIEMFDDNGDPYAGGWIRVHRDIGPAILTKIDQDGRLLLPNLLAGEWQIEFYTESGIGLGIENVTVIADETIALVFSIGEKPRPPNMDRIVPPY
jgi:hypothetical protein